MAFFERLIERSSLILLIITTLACVTKIISTAIVTHLATSVLSNGSNFTIAAAASALELLGLFALTASIGLFLRRVSRNLLLIALIPGAVLGVVGTTLSIVVLVLTTVSVESTYKNQSLYSSTKELSAAGLAIAAIGVVPQTAFFILILPHWNEASSAASSTTSTTSQRSSTFRSDKRRPRSITLESLESSPPRWGKSPLASASPYFAAPTSRRSPSLRHNPITSRTRLLLGSGSISSDTRSIRSGIDSITSPTRCMNNDFENWDTSAVEGQYDNQSLQRRPLETIPGSRPVSPARALDGPFTDDQRSPEETPLPDSPKQSPNFDSESLRSCPKPGLRKDNAPTELHIHPLFRSESPVPPPLTSPNTVITGSPYAGQVVSPELVSPRLLHSAQSSRPASPSRLTDPGRAGSVTSFRTAPTSPLYVERCGRS